MAGEGTKKDANQTVTPLTEYSGFKKAIANNPALISGYSKLLQSAGYYRGPITGKYTPAFQKALDRAEEDRLSISAIRPITRDEFLKEQVTFGTGGDGGPTTTTQTYVTSPSQTAKLLDTVAEDLLGRKLTKEEKNKYTQLINAQQKKQPSVTTSGQGFSSTRGGIDEQQFVTEKIGATTEAKTNRATDAYSIMMQELGGLR
jgi:hypothetical protein